MKTTHAPDRIDEWMSASEAARSFGVHRNTVLQRIATGRYQIRIRRVGGMAFLHRGDVGGEREREIAELAAQAS